MKDLIKTARLTPSGNPIWTQISRTNLRICLCKGQDGLNCIDFTIESNKNCLGLRTKGNIFSQSSMFHCQKTEERRQGLQLRSDHWPEIEGQL